MSKTDLNPCKWCVTYPFKATNYLLKSIKINVTKGTCIVSTDFHRLFFYRLYRRFHGHGSHLGSGANAAKFTVNVWEKW